MAQNLNSNVKLNPIGINLPITRGNNGYFNQTFDSVSQTKINIFNLLNTKRGERRFQPYFGSGLESILFEQNIDGNTDIIKQMITDDIKTWIPNVDVINVDLAMSDDDKNQLKDIYKVYIKITFAVNNTVDSVDLILQKNRI